jgi:hypothetical protein
LFHIIINFPLGLCSCIQKGHLLKYVHLFIKVVNFVTKHNYYCLRYRSHTCQSLCSDLALNVVPSNSVNATDAGVCELVEQGGRKVEISGTRTPGASVSDEGSDSLAVV